MWVNVGDQVHLIVVLDGVLGATNFWITVGFSGIDWNMKVLKSK